MKIMKKKYKSAIVHFNKIKNVTPPPPKLFREYEGVSLNIVTDHNKLCKQHATTYACAHLT